MLESHSEPAPPQGALRRSSSEAFSFAERSSSLEPLQGAPPTLPQATNFPQAFQYYADISIDRIHLSAARVSCGDILYHYRKLLRWKGLFQGGFKADL
jgi:hypothetical protein